jgi:hypothetical protein
MFRYEVTLWDSDEVDILLQAHKALEAHRAARAPFTEGGLMRAPQTTELFDGPVPATPPAGEPGPQAEKPRKSRTKAAPAPEATPEAAAPAEASQATPEPVPAALEPVSEEQVQAALGQYINKIGVPATREFLKSTFDVSRVGELNADQRAQFVAQVPA